jgi:hypothetical protein
MNNSNVSSDKLTITGLQTIKNPTLLNSSVSIQPGNSVLEQNLPNIGSETIFNSTSSSIASQRIHQNNAQ